MTYNHQSRPSNKAEKLPYINLTHIKKKQPNMVAFHTKNLKSINFYHLIKKL